MQAPLLAVGSRGDDGAPGELPGAPGQDGGKGGMIKLQGSGGISINADIAADAGNGGNGGNAAISSGGAGGRGGNAGMAGKISLVTADADITQAAGTLISAQGGNGGSGGAGGDGGATLNGKGRAKLIKMLRHGGKRAVQLLNTLETELNGGAGGNGGTSSGGGA